MEDLFIIPVIIVIALITIGLIFAKLYQRSTKEVSFVRTWTTSHHERRCPRAPYRPRYDTGQHEYRLPASRTRQRASAYHP